ncbi:MAG: radical SAM protein [Elusimicrobia bacterium]|nr:radical SAM protein [Elusimicrobiota bacterium]
MNIIDQLVEDGKQFFNEKKYPESIAVFRRLIEIAPDNDLAHFELGKIYLFENKTAQAMEELLKAVALNHANTCARLLLAKLYKRAGRYAEAIEEFKKVKQQGYAEENIEKEIADVYTLSGDFVQAHEFLSKALHHGYDSAQFAEDTHNLGLSQIRIIQEHNMNGRYLEAQEAANRARGIVPREKIMLHNTILNEIEIAQKKIYLDSKIRSLTVTLTNKCNLRCIMCEMRKTQWDLPAKTCREIIALLPSLERVMWQGGEAFLFEGFEELLDESSRYPLRQVLSTNGTLITERIAEKLVKYNVELTFSIDGITKAVYEHIRPGAVFEEMLSKVALINDLRARYNPKMSTRLNVLIMRSNVGQLCDFLDFAHRYKFTTVFFNASGCDFKDVQENIFYFNFNAEIVASMNVLRKEVEAKAEAYGIRLENWLPTEKFFNEVQSPHAQLPPSSGSQGLHEPLQCNPLTRENSELFCHAPWQRLNIACGGNVYPDCLCPETHSVGNVLEHSILEMWNGEKIQQLRRTISQGSCRGFCSNDCVCGRVPKMNLKYI